ncbi:hypothetical protein GCM10015535_28730 [Streptomyces gelaticus]|uniref:Transposase (putative) YhgA-like domain-containing protein n=1 Tax=Streptomyces gelaticus TaxID=285446 RepID=A0ABQ2W0C0_9ACTN|nr:hypothetical protein GCM10015535_28730 [Streptomyces gelaticus]
MVSSPHEAMHRIFQEYTGLFSRVSDVLGVDIPPPTSATALPTDLTEARPVERRVDTLLRIETEVGGPFLLAIEAQGKKDPDKTVNWPYYVTYLHNRYRLPVLLLVVCQDHATAQWAARPISIGLLQWQTFVLSPLVVGPHNMPVITDVAEARKDLALATLAAITHADNPDVGVILKTLSAALRDTPEAMPTPSSNSPHRAWATARPHNSGGTWWPWTRLSTSPSCRKKSGTKAGHKAVPRTSCSYWNSAASPFPTGCASGSPTAATPRLCASGS